MISTKHWPSPFENAPTFDADGVLETRACGELTESKLDTLAQQDELPWDAEDQRLAMAAGVELVIADPCIVPAEVE